MDEEDDNDFENAEEVEFDSDWQAIDADGEVELNDEWVTYLAQTDPPSNVEGVDTNIPDFEEAQEGHYA